MKNKKAIYQQKTRKDISNPFHHITHEELLRKAQVIDLRDNIDTETLENGRIIAKPIDPEKKFK